MVRNRRASKRTPANMDWRIDLIREGYMRVLAAKAAAIEAQQAQAKAVRAAELKHQQTKDYIRGILGRRERGAERAIAQ